ncbi:Short chain dehydrogenase family protein [Pyrenophora tritici-repentis]|nr:Short chain dehydrogenase family protein [Pyrenophora tritici-repentis]KAI2477577.1 Short chain dehydrogenase family protein [Pyrenophora tritici-repentis]
MSPFRPSAHALITGGASGIGHAVARLCLSHSMHVTLVDNSASALSHAQTTLQDLAKEKNATLSIICADVSSRSDWARIKQIVNGAQNVDFLMLNAGVGGGGSGNGTKTWGDSGYFDEVLGTNLGGVVEGLNVFVPGFLRDAGGKDGGADAGADREKVNKAIVVTGSKQGITNPPGNPAYNASKAAVKTLTEHLSWYFRGTGVGVHLLVPGWTFTGLAGNTPTNTTPKPDGAWSADQVAEYMYEKMQENKFYIVCPDGQVTEEMDRKRMLWSVGDVVEGRPPLSRWREEWKGEVERWMEG